MTGVPAAFSDDEDLVASDMQVGDLISVKVGDLAKHLTNHGGAGVERWTQGLRIGGILTAEVTIP